MSRLDPTVNTNGAGPVISKRVLESSVVIDDSQPYPVFGFIEARLHKVDVVHGGEPVGHTHLEGTQP